MTKKTRMALLLAAGCVLWLGARWANTRAQPRHTLGTINGRLADCPDCSNCVSTRAGNSEYRMDPIPFTQSAEVARHHLEATIRSMPRSQIISSQTDYVHAEFTSLLLGFVDDVEFSIDETEHVIHFRSASRLGRSDLGVNRKRMERVRQSFQDR